LLDVFDTNHDGKLDSGDTDWSHFKVMVTNADGTTSLDTLSSLGITGINLITNNQLILLPDGSRVTGESTYTKSDGTTGTAADAVFAYDGSGYVVAQTVTHNGDGSTTIDNKAFTTGGTLASEITSTINASGTSKTTTFDDNGDGVVDRKQTDATVTNGDGSKTETIANYNGNGTVLTGEQVTTTSADGKTTTISRDATGSGHYDEAETDVIGGTGTQTVTAKDLHRDGSTKDVTITVTSSDGLSKTVQLELTATGAINSTETDNIVVGGGGTRTETIDNYAGSGTTSAYLVNSTVTTSSADGSSQSIVSDLDGNGTTDLTTTNAIVHNADGSTTTTQTETNGNASTRDVQVVKVSADGNTRTTQIDADGNGTYERQSVDAVVLNADGSTT
jgi:hypothetical protein